MENWHFIWSKYDQFTIIVQMVYQETGHLCNNFVLDLNLKDKNFQTF